MHVITPDSPLPRRSIRPTRGAAVELLGLTASTAVVLTGLLLTYLGRTQALTDMRGDLARGSIVDLRRLSGPSDLSGRLTTFSSPFERDVVAAALYRRAMADPPIEHVGALADVTIPAADIRKDSRFAELRARLDRHPGLARVPALTPSDLSALKSSTIVRTPDEFRRQVRGAALLFVGAFWAAHLVRWRRRFSDDPLLLPIVLTLAGVGMMSMIALRDPLRDSVIAFRFAEGVAAGAALLV